MLASVARDIEELRNAVIDLGLEREKNREQAETIADSIRELLVEADAAGMTRTEFARLIGVDRTNLYKVYVNPD